MLSAMVLLSISNTALLFCYRIVHMRCIYGAGKVPMKWSYTHTSCTSCRNICYTACVLSICASSVHAGVSVMHSSVICEASFSKLASRTHLVQRNGMSARDHTSCTVSAMVDLVGFRFRAWHLSQGVTIRDRVLAQYKAHSSLCQQISSMTGIFDAVHNSNQLLS
jgi:hypothetical protein